MIPKGAKFEVELSPHAAIYDVSHLLPCNPKRKYQTRDAKVITSIVIHKSGADGLPGFEGLTACVNYVIRSKVPPFPGAAYTYWLSREPDVDERGRYVIYRAQPDEVHSWHTGGELNRTGVAIGVQGNYDGQWDLIDYETPKIDREPTAAQQLMLATLTEHLAARHQIKLDWQYSDGLHALTGHWEHGKLVCPGDWLRRWVMTVRGESKITPLPVPIIGTKMKARDLQTSLKALGFDPGPIDGQMGFRTRAALERFQGAAGVTIDGWYGPRTAAALRWAIAKNGQP